ncbi:hypothetical protein WH47_07919 [Habropoda laboriosa]|uniref:Zonadhesin n=1 Tax=Habropoda laboriosa TaxID=597456 RepID=A0A0L7RHQ7_9HYME|nr:PREDICTED: hepatitis A virus cellular receptor 1-like isoform X2 [Habropoda laboriosa]KOC70512.1 hypothetical protein WH47_07919 [Habropoda laboriosa]
MRGLIFVLACLCLVACAWGNNLFLGRRVLGDILIEDKPIFKPRVIGVGQTVTVSVDAPPGYVISFVSVTALNPKVVVVKPLKGFVGTPSIAVGAWGRPSWAIALRVVVFAAPQRHPSTTTSNPTVTEGPSSTTTSTPKPTVPPTGTTSWTTESITNTPDWTTLPTTNTPDWTTLPTTDTPDWTTLPTTDTPDWTTLPTTDTPDWTTLPTTDTPDWTTLPTTDTPDWTTLPTTDTPDWPTTEVLETVPAAWWRWF